MINRKWLSLALMFLLMNASSGYSQSSKRSILITKCEQAAKEVEQGRLYIAELEKQLADEEAAHGLATKEAGELRESIDALKAANAERIKEIGKLQVKINKLEGQVSFWRKVAGISAVIAAAVVLLK
jgi:chromosome segregation ATPase